jgi:hypothetical protein
MLFSHQAPGPISVETEMDQHSNGVVQDAKLTGKWLQTTWKPRQRSISSGNSEQKDGSEVKKHAPRILDDEFCDDKDYENCEDLVDDEVLVERIIITPDCQSDWREPVVKKLVDEKLGIIGLNSLRVKVNGSNRARFVSCEVDIDPVKRKVIQGLEFPMRRWKIVIPS